MWLIQWYCRLVFYICKYFINILHYMKKSMVAQWYSVGVCKLESFGNCTRERNPMKPLMPWVYLMRVISSTSKEKVTKWLPWHPVGSGFSVFLQSSVDCFCSVAFKTGTVCLGLLFIFFVLCVRMFTDMRVCILPVCSAHRGQKRASHLLELWLQTVVSQNICARTKSWVLYKSIRCYSW